MRKIANVRVANANTVRLMICDKGASGVFIFGYNLKEDSPCTWDCCFEDLENAYEMGRDYGIEKHDWQQIEDTPKYCQDDWISPVRVEGRPNGNPQWGKLEKLVNGQWVRFEL